MDLNDIDKDLIRKIRNHSVELDKEALWRNIQTKQKKKRGVIIYLVPILLLLLIVGTYMMTSLGDDIYSEILSHDTHTQDIGESSSATIKTEDAQKVITDRKHTRSRSGNTSTELAEAVTASSSKLTTTENTSTGKLVKNLSDSKPQNISNSEPTKEEQATIHAATSSEKKASPFSSSNSSNFLPKFPFINDVDRHKKTRKQENIIVNKKTKISAAQPNHKEQASISYLPTINSASILINNLSSNPVSPTSLFPNIDYSISVINKKTAGLELDFLFGIGYIDKKISSEEIAGINERSPLEIRQQSEAPLEEINAGLHLSFPLTKNLYLKSGIQYSQINEKMMYSDLLTEMVTLDDQITTVIIDTEGLSTNKRGSIEAIQNTITHYTFYNRYRSIDIPLALGYNIVNGKWNLGLETGILWNSYFSFDGALLDSNNTIANTGESFKSRTNIKYTGGMSLSYQFAEKWKWKISPSYVYGPSKINTSDNPIDQSYNLLRIQSGFSYAF